MTGVPLTAWEQAGVIALVLMFVLILIDRFRAFTREMKAGADDTNKVLQAFITERDVQWQAYLADLRKADYVEQRAREEEFSRRNGRVVEATDVLAKTISQLVEETKLHNVETQQAIADMRFRTQPLVDRRRPRQPRATDNG